MTTLTKTKSVYFFGNNTSDGTGKMRTLLGGKGANLAEMTLLGIPVPPGFTISTDECEKYYSCNKSLSSNLIEEIKQNIHRVEDALNLKFGDSKNPLLFSVRSGSRVSMPGMMDTVLNLGLNDEAVKGLAIQSGSERFAWDSYRRFIQMFSNVVLGLEHHSFEHILADKKKLNGVSEDTDLSVDALKELVGEYKALVEKSGKDFPLDPMKQLEMSVGAVFGSWDASRAIKYRQINNIPHEWGTAVNVQAMVFGNLGDTSGTGVAFTRNPSDGDKAFYGEYLINAQGEDVVAGIRTPNPIAQLEKIMPDIYQELVTIYKKLETHFSDMQDIEFTIQDKKLYLLQTRNGKRTAAAAIKIAVDMVKEGMITKKEAINRVTAEQIDQLLHPMIDPTAKTTVLAKGLPASPGAAVGQLAFTAEDAEQAKSENKPVLLVREETSPEDIGGMNAAEGILTARGGMTSHAAVVARGMGKSCVAGCGALQISASDKTLTIDGKTYTENDWLTINGTTGQIIEGKAPLMQAELTDEFEKLMSWADEIRTLKIRTNAETAEDCTVAKKFGAEGIGLCRTEHMFFEKERIQAVREMILSGSLAGRKKALAKIEPMQEKDFYDIFSILEDMPVTVRLLDPPLHEFLPHDQASIEQAAKDLNVTTKVVEQKINSLKETNPMLGHRGCRLGVSYPEIYEMQAQAIMNAACRLSKEGKSVKPEIMIPLIGEVLEFKVLRQKIEAIVENVFKETGTTIDYLIGTMIEIPRAALTAEEIANEADFFSFGTNDLTQLTFGISRDDAGVFLPEYVEKGILASDPFQELDQKGVGRLINIAVEDGRRAKPNLKIGICGEHGGEPNSIEFCYKAGFDYVSCSPYRVPIARLVAAQVACD
ncbi:pyruvate, phosphate dikinase [bacterium]|jgi:pyruvate, orthophosphate dikinase|nr:pyruvate, phosphate dikinase [bacterium]